MMVVGFVVLFILTFLLRCRFILELKKGHSASWESLGRPGLLPINGMRDALSQLEYLFTRSYLSSDSKPLILWASIYRACLLIYFVYFVALLPIAVIFIKNNPIKPH
jgi:hypothetical protein